MSRYASGAVAPPRPTRAVIAAHGGPPIEAWDDHILEPEPRAPLVTRDAPAASPAATAQLAGRLQRHAASMLDELDAHTGTVGERVRTAKELASAIATLGKITGTSLTDREVMASSAWRGLLTTIADALRPYPEALAAVQAACAEKGGAS